MNEEHCDVETNEEQALYAQILSVGMRFGLLLLIVTFFLYVLGILKPAVPLDALDNYWELDVHTYLEKIEEHHLHTGHLITGWSWVKLLNKGDYLNFSGIAILSCVTIICFLAIIPTLLRKGDKVYAIVAFLEALILTLAASGILAGGH